MSDPWQGFEDELARWQDAGREPDFWWRDDDAQRPDPALARLTDLARRHDVPLALAVIPAELDPALAGELPPQVSVLQHGSDHRNRALPGGKKTEFAAEEAPADALLRLTSGWDRLARGLGDRSLRVLVPPWNRVSSPTLLPALARAGYVGISGFGARAAAFAAPRLRRVNTHVDIIDWRGTRGFVGEDAVLAQAVQHLSARRTGAADVEEATGWLTHHAVHDAAAWDFLQALFERTGARAGVAWKTAPALFQG